MGVNRYIGARYVPKFMGQWQLSVTYEPLSIVTHNGTSYTSKKVVPANTPLPDNVDSEFWAVTGITDSQILQINSRLNNHDSQIADLNANLDRVDIAINDLETVTAELNSKCAALNKGRKFILISDSFGLGVTSSGVYSNYGWAKAFKNSMPNGTVFILADNVSGVTINNAFSGGNYSWEVRLREEILPQIADPNEITDIVVMGGSNEVNNTDAITAAMNSFISYANSTFKNARIKIGMLGTRGVKSSSTVYDAYRHCVEKGCEFIYDSINLFCNPGYVSDGTHLTEEGYIAYIPYLFDLIITGKTRYNFNFILPLNMDTDHYSSILGNDMLMMVSNEGCEFLFGNLDQLTFNISNKEGAFPSNPNFATIHQSVLPIVYRPAFPIGRFIGNGYIIAAENGSGAITRLISIYIDNYDYTSGAHFRSMGGKLQYGTIEGNKSLQVSMDRMTTYFPWMFNYVAY